MYRAACILTVVGSLLLVVAIALPLVFPKLFESKINKKLLIQPDTQMVKNFMETPVPIYFQIWLFNVTNAEDVLNGEKPILDQVGPYTYLQRRQRVDLQWHSDTGTVAFKSKKTFYFEPDRSAGLESDMVTTIDPVFTTLVSKLSKPTVASAIRSVAQLWFLRFKNRPFMVHEVGELLFGGYDEPLLGELFKLTKDPAHKRAKSGFFFGRNGTLSGETEVFTGELGMSNYQQYYKYHTKENLDYWTEDRCNMLNGTNGAQFPRPINTSQPLYLFTANLCRSIYISYEKDVKLGPLTLKRFVLTKELLDKTDENNCYCSSNFTCRAGMIDVSPCRDGKPVIISTPHFYQGDVEDQTAVQGLNPSKEEHETRIDVEPTTGVSMRVAKRIQVNMPLRRYAEFPYLTSVPELVLPILWVNESVEVPMERVEKLHTTLTLPKQIVTYGCWALLGLGILLILIAFVLTCSTYKKNKKLQTRRQQLRDKKPGATNVQLLEKNKLYQVS